MTKRHKVFVSYHHDNDQTYRDRFEKLFADFYDILVRRSVGMGDIDENLPTDTIRQKIRDEYLRDSTVTVVLVGAQTWQRKHVDWEIGSSLRHTEYNPRSGLLGILLPTYPLYSQNKYEPSTIPPRLADNLNDKPKPFASIHKWTEEPVSVQTWIHEAFLRRDAILPNNARPSFGRNWTGERWTD